MPTCKDFLRELSEYLDSSIDAETRQELDRHAAECPNCWVLLDTTQKTLKIYKGCEPQAVPAGIEAKLVAAIQKKMAEKKAAG